MQYDRNKFGSSAFPSSVSRVYTNVPMAKPAANIMPEIPPVNDCEASELSSKPLSLAMAYVKYQDFSNISEPEKALAAGTLFSDLEMPFYGKRGV